MRPRASPVTPTSGRLQRFGLAQGAEVEVLVEEDRIVVIPKRSRAARLAAAAEEVLAGHDETFRRLAQ